MTSMPESPDPPPIACPDSPAEPLPPVALTMGDPAGIGPELCLRLLAMDPGELGARPVLIGSRRLLERVAQAARLPVPDGLRIIGAETDLPPQPAAPVLVDLDSMPNLAADAAAVEPGRVGPAAGRLAAAAVEQAIRMAVAGRVQAVCTAPANKLALHAAGIGFPGHTEWFAARTGARRWCMCFHTDELIVSLVTIHVGYLEVPGLLNPERIAEVIDLTGTFARDLLGRAPRLAVLGLNPHAGEGGRFGAGEEERLVQPGIDLARRAGWQVDGPLPPDTAFIPARRLATDAYVCLYHDQGLIPLKMLAFDRAVNLTLGLPIIRTSVDHGTAFDIAWQGRAQVGSLVAAMRLAARLASATGRQPAG